MEAPLKSFCIACARFASGDTLGQGLAVLATSPYFVIYHVAVLVHARRELHMTLVLLGLLLVSGQRRRLKPAAACAPLLLPASCCGGLQSMYQQVAAQTSAKLYCPLPSPLPQKQTPCC